MGIVRRLLAKFKPPPVDQTAGMTQKAVYEFGYQNGFAWGEVVGRKQAFEDILEHLTRSGRVIEEIVPADVSTVRARSTH